MYLVCYLYPTGEMEVGGGAIVYLAVGFVSYMYPVPNFLLLCAELSQTSQMMSFR